MSAGELRRPRGAVKVGGMVMPSLKEWTWDGNTMFQADTFTVILALSGLPAGYGADWLATQTDLSVELFAGFPADPAAGGTTGLDSLFVGVADEVMVDWTAATVTLTGRDLTAAFLDNKTSEKFPSQTASQIATTLAKRRHLDPKVTTTKAPVGRYYKDAVVRLEDDRTEWDLLTWLAREEGFVVYVQGKELHFESPPAFGSYGVNWTPGDRTRTPTGNVVRAQTTRVLTIAKDISVTVHSTNSKLKKSFTRKATRPNKGSGTVQNHDVVARGLDPQGAQVLANQILAELSRHEMRLTIDGPADNLLHKGDLITFTGTGTAFDQTYFPDSVQRTFSTDAGYGFHVSAKNHSPESQPSL